MIIKNAKVYSDGCRFVEKDLIIRNGRIVFGAAAQEGEEIIEICPEKPDTTIPN